MKEELYVEAGARIQEIRLKRGYTRDQIAILAGISPKFLYEIENGKKGFSVSVLMRLSQALEINCDYILTGNHVRGSQNEILLGTLDLFDGEQTQNLIQLLRIVYQFVI